MPLDAKKLQKLIKKEIYHTKKTVQISAYHFTNKKISKYLKKIAKKGVVVTVVFDDKNSKQDYSLMKYLAKYKNFKIHLMNKEFKLHQNYMILDKKSVIFGSANFSKSAFMKNLEFIVISHKKAEIGKFLGNFSWLIKHANIYD
jgi:phosphatidylserine/phosphatidylglycerophosphate/cardiolipin synthase-like enzyme